MTIEKLYNAFLECNSISTDTRKITPDCMFFALKGVNFNGNTFAFEALKKGAKYVVIDEVQDTDNEQFILVADALKALQQLATHHRQVLNIPVIALTGSNGKTTTKELINAVLSSKYNTSATKGNLNNHIGVPLTLLEFNKQTELGIVEMGANHQKEIEFLSNIARPDYGLITNFGKAHLEGFGGVEGVIKGKSELYDHLKSHHKHIFINTNDPIQIERVKGYNLVIPYGEQIKLLNAKPFVSFEYRDTKVETRLVGAYNFNNIAAAVAIGIYFKVDVDAIIKAIENYVPQNNRSQIVETSTNRIILDAYNANPTSMIAALDYFGNMNDSEKIAILGDMFELGDDSEKEHQSIAEYAQSFDISHIYLVGKHFSNVQYQSDKISTYKTFESFKSELQINTLKNKFILIKGSRGMALERILDIL